MLDLLIRKRLGVILLFCLLCAGGAYLATRLSIQLYPRVNRPRLMTSIRHSGYSAVQFHGEYADAIEARLLAIEGLEILEARYSSNQSSFTMTFDWDSDADVVKADAEAVLTSINNSLPSELRGDVNVHFFSGENAGYLMLGLTSESLSPEDLFGLVKAHAEPALLKIKDVDALDIFNVEELRASITLRQLDMLHYGVTIADVNTALQAASGTQSIGTLTEGPLRLSVGYTKSEPELFDLGTLVVKQVDGVDVTLDDVSDTSIYYTIPRETFVMDGSVGVQVVLSPVDGGNIRMMSAEAQRVLADMKGTGSLPADTKINALLDPADYIDRSIESVLSSMILGAVLAMVIVFLLLGEVRNSLLIGLSIPVSLVLAFLPMYAMGVSLNLISLGGMALAVGMIVDASIVVMENLHRYRLEESHDGGARHLKDLIIRSVKEVRTPVISSALTSILVFLPLSFTAPLTNAILGDQAKVIVFTLAFSLVAALIVVPVVSFLLYRNHDIRAKGTAVERARKNPSEALVHFLEGIYSRSLRAVVTRKPAALALLLASAALMAVSALLILPRLPKEIMSAPQSDRLIVFLQATGDVTSEEVIENKIPQMNAVIGERLGSRIVKTYAEVRGRMNRIFLVLKSTRDANLVTAELQRLFPSDNDWYYNVMNWDPAQLPLPRTNDLRIDVSGPDATVLIPLLERIRDLVTETGHYAWVSTNPSTAYTDELSLKPRKETFGKVGAYSETALLSLVRRILGGTQTREYEYGNVTVDARAVYPDAEIKGRINLANFLLPYRQSAVPLKHFFDFEASTNVSQIVSENGDLVFRVYADRERGAASSERRPLEAKTKEYLAANLTVPEGCTVTFANPAQEMDSAIVSLLVSLAVSIALIYLLLAFQYNSLVIPLIVLAAVPLGFIGLIFSLSVFRSTLCLNSLLGAILLSGIVVNNSIIMIDFYIVRRKQLDRTEALVKSAVVRLRPILITSLTTVFGMLPIAIGMGEGASVIKPLGIAVSGGLTVSTLLTLYVVPAVISFTRVGENAE